MTTPTSNLGPARRAPSHDRRSATGLRGAWNRLKGLLRRPVALEKRDGRLHLVLVERRRAAPRDAGLAALREELHDRVLTQQANPASKAMRHVVFVHDTLQTQNWDAVARLPSRVLDRAIVQAEMLSTDAPSPHLVSFIERLRPLCSASAEREERMERARRIAQGKPVEVSEASAEDFDAVERHWLGEDPTGPESS